GRAGGRARDLRRVSGRTLPDRPRAGRHAELRPPRWRAAADRAAVPGYATPHDLSRHRPARRRAARLSLWRRWRSQPGRGARTDRRTALATGLSAPAFP